MTVGRANVAGILEAIAAVTEADLEAIDTELAEIEARAVLLRDARKLIVAKLHPEQVKRPGGRGKARTAKKTSGETQVSAWIDKPAAAKPPESKELKLHEQIRLILEASGPMTVDEITRQLESQRVSTTAHAVLVSVSRMPSVFAKQPSGRYALVR